MARSLVSRRDGQTLRGQPPYHLPTKLTDDDVAWIKGVLLLDRRVRRNAGLKRRTVGPKLRLAQKFDVSIWTIEAIDRGRRWQAVRGHRWDEREIQPDSRRSRSLTSTLTYTENHCKIPHPSP